MIKYTTQSKVKNFFLNTSFCSKCLTDNDYTAVRMVTRDEWRAKPPTEELVDLELPAKYVIIQHTVQPSCDSVVISERIS